MNANEIPLAPLYKSGGPYLPPFQRGIEGDFTNSGGLHLITWHPVTGNEPALVPAWLPAGRLVDPGQTGTA